MANKKIDLKLLSKTIKAILGQDTNIKELNGKNSIDVSKNDILIYNPNGQFYFYKVKKNGSITVPNKESCTKLSLGNGGGDTFTWDKIKKKILNGITLPQ